MKRWFWGYWILAGALMVGVAPAPGWAQGSTQRVAANQPRTPASEAPLAKFNWNGPLPSAVELKQRVLANYQKSEAEQERYVCKTTNENDQTDKNGEIKHRDVKRYDMFFVNSQEIDEVTSKDGKPLTENQKKKESERVQKQIKKDSDEKYVAKQNADNEKMYDEALQMLRYTNGRRVDVNGRPTLDYDLSGDPKVHPKGLQEAFLHDMTGTIQVDEISGQLLDLNAHLDHDLKLGGGLLASLHKGFWIHLRQQHYPGGVWLMGKVEGTGDARAALFFHPYFKFSRTISGCALTNVTTSQGPTTLTGTSQKQ